MSEQDEANLLRWLDGDPMTISQDELVATVRRILAERDAARAALDAIAKQYTTKYCIDYETAYETIIHIAREALKGTPNAN